MGIEYMRYYFRLLIIGLFACLGVFITASQDNMVDYALEDVQDVSAVAWSSNGTTLAIAGVIDENRGIWFYDNDSGRITGNIAISSGILSISWNSGGSHISTMLWVSNGTQHTIWDVETGDMVHTIEYDGAVSDLESYWSPNGDYLATVISYSLSIWNTSDWSLESEYYSAVSPADYITSVAWLPDSSGMFIATEENVIRTWDISSDSIIAEQTLQITPTDIALAPNGDTLAIGSIEGTIQIISLSTDTLIQELNGQVIHRLDWASDNVRLVSVDAYGNIIEWDALNGQMLNIIKAGGSIRNSDWNPDGTIIAIIAYFGTRADMLQVVPLSGE